MPGSLIHEQRGDWPDFVVLVVLGLVVEFRLLESAWPAHLRLFNRLILLDTGLYGFLVIRQLTNVGFHFVPRWQDVKTGLRELSFYAPIAIPLGLGLGFLHFHAHLPSPLKFALSWISIFAFIAVLEETYFRGWVQNLLERRVGQRWSLLTTSVCSGCRTLIKVRRTSIGDMCCWHLCRNFLRQGMERGLSLGGVRDYPRVRGHDMVALASMKRGEVLVVAKIAKSNPHPVVCCVGNSDRKADAEEAMRNAQRIEVPIPQKKRTRCCAPQERHRDQQQVGKVYRGEQHGCRDDCRGLVR